MEFLSFAYVGLRMRKDYRQLCRGQLVDREGDGDLSRQPYLLALACSAGNVSANAR
jgi:hypothetical protein